MAESEFEQVEERQGFLDVKGRNKTIFIVFTILCALSLLAEVFIHPHHPHFHVEHWPGFYAAWGFMSFVVLVVVARFILRPLVSRREDYYD